MNILSAEALAKSFHDEPLFAQLDFSLSKGQKIALVGANGCGKSTLLKILCGIEIPDSGTVSVRKGIATGYLAQAPGFDGESTIRECIFADDIEVFRVMGEYERLIETRDADAARLQQLADRIEALGAWDIEHTAREVLGKLGIHGMERKINRLSGGEQKRIALARLLITEPDLLLLDEPTNHLDLEMIEWLESYLGRLNRSMVLVTHDRYFLNGICNTICELSKTGLFTVKGNYAWFLEKKQEREEAMASSARKAGNTYRRELEWMRRQPKARGTKQKARIESFYQVEEKANALSRGEKLNFSMQMERIGKKVLELEFVCKSYGDKVLLKDLTYTFKKGERIGVIGRNGIGKSTLLKLIMGFEKPDQGRIRRGETIRFGYFGQEGLRVKGDQRVFEVMKEIADYVETGTGKGKWTSASRFLTHFNFPPHRQQTPVARLSGGEKQRLHLLTVLAGKPNFLILDEPTNDLDIETLNALEEFLDEYEGCMLVVSHDRYFLDRLVDHVFVFEGAGLLRVAHGNYSDYRFGTASQPPQETKESAKSPTQAVRPHDPEKKKGLTFKEKRELEQLESDMQQLEQKKQELVDRLNDATLGHDVLHETALQYEATEQRLKRATERWLDLSEKQ